MQDNQKNYRVTLEELETTYSTYLEAEKALSTAETNLTQAKGAFDALTLRASKDILTEWVRSSAYLTERS